MKIYDLHFLQRTSHFCYFKDLEIDTLLYVAPFKTLLENQVWYRTDIRIKDAQQQLLLAIFYLFF